MLRKMKRKHEQDDVNSKKSRYETKEYKLPRV